MIHESSLPQMRGTGYAAIGFAERSEMTRKVVNYEVAHFSRPLTTDIK